MNTHEKIECALRKLPWKLQPELDDRTLADGLAAFDAGHADPSSRQASSSDAGPAARRGGLLRGPWGKLGLAASFAAAVILALLLFNKSVPLSLADIQQAVALQTWVHIKFDSGREEWFDLQNERYFLKEEGFITNHRMLFVDRVSGVSMDHFPYHGRYINKWQTGSWPGPRTPWQCVVGMLGERVDTNTKRQSEAVDGRQLIRFDDYFSDAYGKPVLRLQVWADPQTHLPVQVRRLLDANDRRELKRDYTIGQCDFPTTGPTRLEDIGVPVNLPVVDGSRTGTPDADQIRKVGQAFQKRFPDCYRAVLWCTDGDSEVDVRWCNVQQYRLDHYFSIFEDSRHPDYRKYHLPVPATLDQVLAWIKQQGDLCHVYIDVGTRHYHRAVPHPAIDGGLYEGSSQPTVRVTSGYLPFPSVSCNWPHREPWSYATEGGPWEVLTESPDIPPGCIAIRKTTGDTRRDAIIDPAHDYIMVNYIWWKQIDGQWRKDRMDQLLDPVQLPTGQWSPTHWRLEQWFEYEGKINHSVSNHSIDVKVLESPDFPPDLFNGEKLLEGAKVETY